MVFVVVLVGNLLFEANFLIFENPGNYSWVS